MKLIFILCFFPSFSQAINPTCLRANLTWSEEFIYNLTFPVDSPDICQDKCNQDTSCKGFSWLTPSASLLPQACALFSFLGEELPCPDCVSGPPQCLCLQEGECESSQGNIIDVISEVESQETCSRLCVNEDGCYFFTYFGEGNPLRNICILYSSCDILDEDCIDCTTGTVDCDTCDWDDTQPDGSCGSGCSKGWSAYQDFCYIVLQNGTSHFHSINLCRSECLHQGGLLASVHSDGENDLIVSILKPAKNEGFDQSAWLGAQRNNQGYYWEDGTEWDYENWREGHADTYPCVLIGSNVQNPELWDDFYCYSSWRENDCVCKKPK